MFVDFDRDLYKLGPLNKDELGENAVSSGTCPSGGGLGATNIGLIVLGIVVFLLLCALAFLGQRWWKRRNNVAKTSDYHTTTTAELPNVQQVTYPPPPTPPPA